MARSADLPHSYIQGVPRNMKVSKQLNISLVSLKPKSITKCIIWQSYYSKINFKVKYILVKEFVKRNKQQLIWKKKFKTIYLLSVSWELIWIIIDYKLKQSNTHFLIHKLQYTLLCWSMLASCTIVHICFLGRKCISPLYVMKSTNSRGVSSPRYIFTFFYFQNFV